ncbi:hypothetical protein D3C79_832110 [compost metagenome]
MLLGLAHALVALSGRANDAIVGRIGIVDAVTVRVRLAMNPEVAKHLALVVFSQAGDRVMGVAVLNSQLGNALD